MQTDLVKITVKVPEDMKAFLMAQATAKREGGQPSDLSDQVRLAIRHRQLALLPEPERQTVLRALGLLGEEKSNV